MWSSSLSELHRSFDKVGARDNKVVKKCTFTKIMGGPWAGLNCLISSIMSIIGLF